MKISKMLLAAPLLVLSAGVFAQTAAQTACTNDPTRCAAVKGHAAQGKAALQAGCSENPTACAQEKSTAETAAANSKGRRTERQTGRTPRIPPNR
jgi:hypothetical protein